MSAKTRVVDAHTAEPEPPQKLAVRDRPAEKRIVKGKQALRLGQLLDDATPASLATRSSRLLRPCCFAPCPIAQPKKITSLGPRGSAMVRRSQLPLAPASRTFLFPLAPIASCSLGFSTKPSTRNPHDRLGVGLGISEGDGP